MNKLKKTVISAAMEEYGKIYIHSLPHPKLVVGERGLINSEKNNGIVLAIGSASCSDFKMEDDYIFAKLRFNGVWENVFIPYEAVDAVLNDLHKPLCIFNFPYYESNEENVLRINRNPNMHNKPKEKKQAVIVRADFTKKNKS